HLNAATLREPQLVLDQGVLGAVAAADHAAPAANAARAGRPVTVEVRVWHLGPGLAEEDADPGRLERVAHADFLAVLLEQRVGGGHSLILGDAEHPLPGLVVGSQLLVPLGESLPLGVDEEVRPGAIEGVGVAEAPASDAGSRDDEHVLEERHPEDASHPEARHPHVPAKVPRGPRKIAVAKALPTLEYPDPVALLGEPERRHAAAETRSDDQPVVVVAAPQRAAHAPSISQPTSRPP